MFKKTTLYLLCAATFAIGQEWHEGTGTVTLGPNTTFAEARKLALNYARTDALQQAGIEITGTSAWVQKEDAGDYYDNFIKYTQTRTKGRIIDEIILAKGLNSTQIADSLQAAFYQVTIKALVELETGKSDPEFRLNLTLNKDFFRNNEEMVIGLSATKDCYVTIFNLFANDSLLVILPCQTMPDNHLKARATLQIPPEGANWILPVGLADDSPESAQEVIYAVATKDNIPFQISGSVMREGLMAQSDALLAVNRWLIDIDAEGKTEAWCFYTIRK